MPSDPSPATRDFLTIVTAERMLSDEAARQVVDEATSRSLAPTQVAMQKGLVSAVQVDIIDTLMRPTQVIPGYEIINALGHGGMGVVYRARQTNLDRIVALKTVLVSQMADPSAAARFEQEAKSVAKLRHPNIVAAYDFGRHEGRLFFAMEFVDGVDVDHLIQEQSSLDEATAWSLARQAASGLAHAAQASVVHRDIKPANLLLVEAPEGFSLAPGLPMVKIADFGLAFLSNEVETRTRLTADNTALGSPHYMAPEQLGARAIDLRTDIYALGATVFHMLAGRPPFSGLTLTQAVTQKLTGDAPLICEVRDDVSDESTDLLAAMMHREPDRRPADYSQLLQTIDEILGAGNYSGLTASFPSTSSAVKRSPDTKRSLHEPAPTIELPKHDDATSTIAGRAAPNKSKRWLIVAGAILVLLLIAGSVAFWPSQPAWQPGERDLRPVGRPTNLFNGRTTEGWRPVIGGWADSPDPDGVPAIFCDDGDGVIGRGLPEYNNYRLTAFVWLGDADSAEFHFALEQTDAGLQRRVLQITKDGVALGSRPYADGAFTASTQSIAAGKVTREYRVIHIERQSGAWWVYFDEKLVGVAPLESTPSRELQLAVWGGNAWFREISIEELGVSNQ